jgi:hypothetical protein
MDRRYFLKSGGITLASFGLMSVAPQFLHQFANAQTLTGASGKKKILITIFQRGAVDGLNMIVPYGDSANRIPGTRVNLKQFEGRNKSEILNRSIAVVLDGEISPNTKATLLKQLEQPLIEPKLETVADNSEDGEAMENTAMMQNQGGGRNRQRQVRLLPPSGNAEVFKVVGLILGTPEFQRQ